MKGYPLCFTPLLLFFLLLSPVHSAWSQKNVEEDVPIDFARQVDPYKETQNHVIAKVKEATRLASAGNFSVATTFTANEIQYLNGVYVACSLKRGSCKELLEGLFELDLIVAKSNAGRDSTCKNMSNFWRSWIKDDWETRLDYKLATGHLAEKERFKRDDRPKYLRCSVILKDKLASTSTENLQERARDPQGPLATFATLLTHVAGSITNVFSNNG